MVVATNVAETSLTIEGIRCVIDSGLARIPRFDPYRGLNTLLIEKISRASADQRAGRAGRTAAGVCFRLWSKEEHAHRAEQEVPEVKRLDLAEVVLTLKAAGVQDLRRFRWLEAPEEQALAHAEELLQDLGAIKPPPDPAITDLGRKMLAFPVHPRYARMLLAAQDHGCAYQACLVAALTQGRDLLLRNVDRKTDELRQDLLMTKASSDFFILMRAWNYALKNDCRIEACRRLGIHSTTARQVAPLFEQFLDIARRESLDVTQREVPEEALQKCILVGFSDRVGRRLDSGTLRCELVHGRRGMLTRESVVQTSPLFVAAEVREIEGKDKSVTTLLSLATAIQERWLAELFPDDMQTVTRSFYDPTTKRVYGEEALQFRGLAIGTRRIDPPVDAAGSLLAEEVAAHRLSLPDWDHSLEQWLLRINLLSQWCPELGLPAVTEDERRHLLEQICHGAFSYKDLKDKPAKSVVKSWLSPAQRVLLDKEAPERLALQNGRSPEGCL